MAEEIAHQIDLRTPQPCPDGMACDRIVVRDFSIPLLGIIILLASGAMFGIERLIRFARMPLQSDT